MLLNLRCLNNKKGMWGAALLACVVLSAAFVFLGVQKAYAVDCNRFYGTEVVDTAVENSKAAFPTTADTVVIACEDDFQDSMSATGLAGAYEAPILLTNRTYLSPQTEKEIDRLQAKNILIIGGSKAVSSDIEKGLKSKKLSVERIAGNESYDTSLKCAQKIVEKTGDAQRAIVATSFDFQDALSISSFAYKFKVPILIQTFGATSNDRGCTQEQQDFLKNTLVANAVTYVPGGVGAVSYDSVEGLVGDANVVRIFGTTGYDTSNALAEYFTANNDPFKGVPYLSKGSVGLANGTPQCKGLDALTSSSVLAGKDAALLLVDNTNSAKTLNNYLYDNSAAVTDMVVFGGTAVISDEVCSTAKKIADGLIHYTAIIGIDTWAESNGNFHLQASDLIMLMRFDEATGATNLVSIPRDTYYDNTHGGTVFPGSTCDDHWVGGSYQCNGMTWQKANYAFHYGFFDTYNGSNYEDAVRAGSIQTCQMMSDVLGVHVDKYAALDLYQYTDLINSLSNVVVDLPFAINNYTFYSGQDPVTIGQGWQTLDGWHAMVASRARVPYGSQLFNGPGLPTYTGGYGFLLLDFGWCYAPEQDGARQFLNRRTFASLMKKGIRAGDTSGLLNGLVSSNLIYTNVSTGEIEQWSNSMRAAASSNAVPIFMASGGGVRGGTYLCENSTGAVMGPYDTSSQEFNGLMATGKYGSQYLVPFEADRYWNTMEQACSETNMSAGWGPDATNTSE